jgi:D-alanyl-lipoteichoic acid acyltransferase DltB (MBOAT superfamily)
VICYFYIRFIPPYIFILLLLIVIDYTLGILIERAQGESRKILLFFSILSTCTVLFIFKYFNFFDTNFARLAKVFHWNYSIHSLSLLLPLGLSFHTFQSLSYVIEVYRGRQKAQRHFGLYALYVIFFPQLVAGPIERPQHLLPQFLEKHDFNYRRVTDGLKLMLWGMFKKVVIADRLAIVVLQVYHTPTHYEGMSLAVATIFFAFQIYCDFSGYSDIAIGAAQTLGFKLVENFNRPYFAKSVAEFWKRWHISLSTWFRDYVYISLGGNKVPAWRWQLNILITFLLSGLWHGANWTFVIWGGLHGFYYLAAHGLKKIYIKIGQCLNLERLSTLRDGINIGVTFFCVCLAWIFFRANSVHDAGYIVTHLFSGWNKPIIWGPGEDTIGLSRKEFLFSVLLIVFLCSIEFLQVLLLRRNHSAVSLRDFLARQPIWLRWEIYLIAVFAIMNSGIITDIQFIYFQF